MQDTWHVAFKPVRICSRHVERFYGVEDNASIAVFQCAKSLCKALRLPEIIRLKKGNILSAGESDTKGKGCR